MTGTVTRSYFLLGSQRIAMRVEADGEDDEVYYFHTDHLGSIAAVSHEFGNYYELVDSAGYLPFGGLRVEPDEELTDRGYTDHRQALDIQLIDMRARWQDPTIGRCAQIRDPDVQTGIGGLEATGRSPAIRPPIHWRPPAPTASGRCPGRRGSTRYW